MNLQKKFTNRVLFISIAFRYEKELHQTLWSSVRKGAVFGIFMGWLSLVTYTVYAVGFIFGSIFVSYGDHNIFNISDILVVSDLYQKSTKK
jgi:hypothetical protein